MVNRRHERSRHTLVHEKEGLASGQSTETELAVRHAFAQGITAPLQELDLSVPPDFLRGQ
jgi:hypothetical protein